ncbi:Cys-Gln thioester bond-forming surface protein [Streptomyces sp. NBC_00879]|uniref:Cys-Gln thioester bond-forming surface protein n=1 Tax=Streptomyces sp. NBC_00879 TaxID=2975855 RepID=UPI00386C0C85|nr:Cys-Gln thioester bond-forming surface protein [Streptomyces sp. NBC_00879]
MATLGEITHGGIVDIPTGDGGALDTGTMALQFAGKKLEVYCIDLHHETAEGAKYSETDWDKSTLSGNLEAGKIAWILNHSYPSLTAEQVSWATGIRSLSEDSAAAGTQAAIWHFSDHVDAVPRDPAAAELTKWLVSHVVNINEPTPSLQLSPSNTGGKSNDKIGPIRVTTNAPIVNLKLSAPDGVTIVDNDGLMAASAANGDDLFISVPRGMAPGSAELTATATTSLPVGRAFKAVDASSQTMILAGPVTVPVTANASAQWAEGSHGAIPSANAREICDKGGVLVELENAGDKPGAFTVDGKPATVKSGGTASVLVAVPEGGKYDIKVTGPESFNKEFTGALKCQLTPGSTPTASSTFLPRPPVPTPPPGSSAGGGHLAVTGSGVRPLAGAAGIVLVVFGGAMIWFLRRRDNLAAKPDQPQEPPTD